MLCVVRFALASDVHSGDAGLTQFRSKGLRQRGSTKEGKQGSIQPTRKTWIGILQDLVGFEC